MYTYVGLSWCNSVFFACVKVHPSCTLMQDCHGVAVYSLPVLRCNPHVHLCRIVMV